MSCLFGWMPRRETGRRALVETMRDGILAGSACRARSWNVSGLTIGAADLATALADPEVSPDSRYHLWAVGELFAGLPGTPTDLQHVPIRRSILSVLLRQGPDALAALDGEYQIALWDSKEQTLALACDRFGALPLYWSATDEGFAFGGRVSALLAAPGVSADPDLDAVREAVTFGGYRLGDRTNIRGVRMLCGARVLRYRGGRVDIRRYWRWPAPPEPTTRPIDDLVDEADGLWRAAVHCRLQNASRPGNTLSGGLDSRAIMAEATSQGAQWTALTYGIPGCDDARIAETAAARAGAAWTFKPLYDSSGEGWLERRVAHIPATDGLVQLGDLMHLEWLDLQTSSVDVHLCGYIGDAVCGPTFSAVADAAALVQKMPYSGVPIAWSYPEAIAWAESALIDIGPGAGRFALFEHKLPQSIQRIFQAAQSRIRVRRVFVDYALFDYFAALDGTIRGRVYHTMLKRRYPHLFARLPHQLTNVPVLTPPFERQARRVARYAWRRFRNVAARARLASPAPSRSYHDEERHWRTPAVSARIIETILRPGSISADVFGRPRLTRFVEEWFAGGPGPVQTIGALYVFEHYHRALAAASPAAPPAAMSATL